MSRPMKSIGSLERRAQTEHEDERLDAWTHARHTKPASIGHA